MSLEALNRVFGHYTDEAILLARVDCNREGSFIKCTNLMNPVSFFLSPVIGIIRLIAAGVLLYKEHKRENCCADRKNLYKAQLLRAVGEILFLGPFLVLIDIAVSCNRYELRVKRAENKAENEDGFIGQNNSYPPPYNPEYGSSNKAGNEDYSHLDTGWMVVSQEENVDD